MYRIAVIAGDGIGPEVVEQGLRVLDSSSRQWGFELNLTRFPFGADHYLATGELLPDKTLEEIRNYDAVYLGAIGDPRVERGVLERGIIGRLRWDLDMYINLRPIRLYSELVCPLKDKSPRDVDMVVVRENTEDAYMGLGGFFKKGTPDEVATCEAIYTRRGTERVIRYAFELARTRPRKHLTMVDKANAGQEYPVKVLANDLSPFDSALTVVQATLESGQAAVSARFRTRQISSQGHRRAHSSVAHP